MRLTPILSDSLKEGAQSVPVMGFSTTLDDKRKTRRNSEDLQNTKLNIKHRWNQFACEINEELVPEQAHKMVELVERVGARYVNVMIAGRQRLEIQREDFNRIPRFPRGTSGWLNRFMILD